MPDILLNRGSLVGIETFALGLGDKQLQERAEELRTLLGSNGIQSAMSGSAATPERTLALNIHKKWSELYGSDVALWPDGLKNSLDTINAGVGFGNFAQNVTAAFQNLRLEDAAYPAFEAGMDVVRGFSPSPLACPPVFWRVKEGWGKGEIGLIPDSAARAGLSFISSPLTLITPIWIGGMAGRATTAGVARAGQILGLAEEAVVSLGTVFGLTAESAGFVASSSVIASGLARPACPPGLWRELVEGRAISSFDRLRMNKARNDMLAETASAAFFFGGLRIFGWAGTVAQRILPATDVGIVLAKLAGHTASVTGLASMEEIEEATGIKGDSPLFRGGTSPSATATTFYERLWRAFFLHATISGVRRIVNVEGVRSEAEEIRGRAEELLDAAMPEFRSCPIHAANSLPDKSGNHNLGRASTATTRLMMSGVPRDKLFKGLFGAFRREGATDKTPQAEPKQGEGISEIRALPAVEIPSPSIPFSELAKNPTIKPRLKLALDMAAALELGREDAWGVLKSYATSAGEPVSVAIVGYRPIADQTRQDAAGQNVALIDRLITGTELDFAVIGGMKEPYISAMDGMSKIGTVVTAFPKSKDSAKLMREKLELAGWRAGIGRVGGRLAIMAVKVGRGGALPPPISKSVSPPTSDEMGFSAEETAVGRKVQPRPPTAKWDGRREDPALAPTVEILAAGSNGHTELMTGGGHGGRVVERITRSFSPQFRGLLSGPGMEKLLKATPDIDEAMGGLAAQVYKIVFLQGLTVGEEVKSRIDMVADLARRMGDTSKAEMKFAPYEEGQLRLFAEVFDSIVSAAASAEQRTYARQLISLLEGSGRDMPGILLLVSRYTEKTYRLP